MDSFSLSADFASTIMKTNFMEVFIMKTFLAFTTGVFVGAIGIAVIYLSSPEVQHTWQTAANECHHR